MDFPDLKTKTNDLLFRSKLTSRACEPRAGLISRLANRNLGLSGFKLIRSSYIRPLFFGDDPLRFCRFNLFSMIFKDFVWVTDEAGRSVVLVLLRVSRL